MTKSIDLFWSFRSPYSYLATRRLVELERNYDLSIQVRPVYPIAVRYGEFFERVHPLWVPYLMRDTMRIAQMLQLPYRWPRPDPVQIDPATRRAHVEQPYIGRLTRLGCAAAETGKGLAFIDQVSRLIWSGTVDKWHEGSHLADASARAGLDLAHLEDEIAREPEKFEAIIEKNQSAHEAAGHWGVPTMVFEGEPFFGQDRIDVLLWRMKQRGLRERGRASSPA
ncbi:MAG: DsbA family protein [Alphaproteobacteria bacterium]|nr:DsbA family protein [Alphaproteobacteria bacterium]